MISLIFVWAENMRQKHPSNWPYTWFPTPVLLAPLDPPDVAQGANLVYLLRGGLQGQTIYHFKKIPLNLPKMGHRTDVVLGRVLETASSDVTDETRCALLLTSLF